MTCTFERDETGKVIRIVCGSPWGVGVYTYRYTDDDGTEREESMYGFGPTANPHDFSPDHECCTPDEIEAHRAACEAWDAEAAK